MKFGQELQTRLTPEWRKQYIDYEGLKAKLYELDTAKLDLESETDQRLVVAKQKADEEFFMLCETELTKVNLFFGMKLAEAQGKFNELTQELQSYKRLEANKAGPSATPKPKILLSKAKADKTARTKHQIKFAFSEFYLSLVLLQKYQEMNSVGFKKILKKRDKIFGDSKGLEWRQMKVEKADFFTNKLIDKLIDEVETTFIHSLEGGDRTAGMKRLKVPPLSEKEHAWTTYRLGLFQGCFVVLLVLIVLTITMREDKQTVPKWVGVRLFRGFMILFTNIWLLGFNMYGWHRAGVNHVLIFDIDPRRHLRYQGLLEIGSFFCMIWAVAVLAFLYPNNIFTNAPPLAMPLGLMIICLLWLFNPFNVFRRSSRIWFVKRVCYCFLAPFRSVTFCDFWLADQMNSLVTFFLDMEYFVCFYATEVDYSTMQAIRATNTTSGVDYATGADVCTSNIYGIRPIISVIPALIRFLQCLRRYRDSKMRHPHLTNAGKYATSFFVVIFGALYRHGFWSTFQSPFLYLWVGAYVISFVYTFTWDVRMDWGFFDVNESGNKFLRDELIYDRKPVYYFAIVEDFILRLAWVLNVSLGAEVLNWEGELLMCVTAPLECIRRFIWNYFRLENEHLNNCGQFRATRDISLRPLKHGEMEELLRKMDTDDGVKHRPQGASRRGKKKRKHEQPKRSKGMQAVKSFQTFFRPNVGGASKSSNFHTVSSVSQLQDKGKQQSKRSQSSSGTANVGV